MKFTLDELEDPTIMDKEKQIQFHMCILKQIIADSTTMITFVDEFPISDYYKDTIKNYHKKLINDSIDELIYFMKILYRIQEGE